jgi:cell division septation protein DedD
MARNNSSIIQISRKGLFIWIGLIVFICIWMFVLGVMVGRGMAPVNLDTGKLDQELAEQKARMLKEKQEAATSAAAGQADERPELGFYEALKNPRKDTTFKAVKPATPATRKPAMKKPEAPAVKPRPKAPRQQKSDSRAKTRSPAATKTNSGTNKASPAAPGHFTIQVASVRDIKGAERMVARLRTKGYQAYQIRSDVAGRGVWYRVRVGGYEDRDAADKVLRKLKNDKFGGMVVSTK